MALPLEEKMKFEQGDGGRSFGQVFSSSHIDTHLLTPSIRYKAAGVNASDEYGTPDTVEFINVSKDDALAYPNVVHRTYPSTVDARMESTIKPFVQKSLEVNNTVLGVFEKKLGLPSGALLDKHLVGQHSGSEARCIRNPPKKTIDGSEKDKVGIGAHTDFGSLSFLHNRLGGLQVLPPGYEEWQYVRPLPGHAICNVGDALTLFSGGILRSNLHRVVPPPGEQALHPRWSLVFFTRPGNDIKLRALSEESELIKNVLERKSADERAKFDPGSTASEWFARRIKYQRLNNRTVSSTDSLHPLFPLIFFPIGTGDMAFQ